MPASQACRRGLALLVLALAASGCWVTETEVVRTGDSIQLAGRRFSMREIDKREPTEFTWHPQRSGYLNPDESMLARFARFQGDVYLAQFEVLKFDEPPGGTPKPDRRAFAVMILKLAPPNLVAQSPSCAKYHEEIAAIARPYGIAIDRRRSHEIEGSREAILGFVRATLACEPETLEGFELFTDTVVPGGPELAALAKALGPETPTALFEQRCSGGEIEVCYRLAQMLQRGEGVPADPARAAVLLEKVCFAARGNAGACVDLAQLHDRGEGVAKDPARAVDLLRKACAAGEMYGCDLLKRRAK